MNHGIPRKRIEVVLARPKMATSPKAKPVPRRTPTPPPYDYCQNPNCGTRKGVYYDRELHLHLCGRCWANTNRPLPIATNPADESTPGTADY